ncbi:MAG: ABC transporter permease [Treponema sp.]|nr:ABC transporter permease [Treponema sp.]
MTIKSSLMFARSLIFPKTEKKSSARRSLFGALICIGLSIVPLVVVLSVASGMIDGMTERIIGLSSNHLQAYVATNILSVQSSKAFKSYSEEFKEVDGVLDVYPEVGISALATANSFRTGAQIRAIDSAIFRDNHFFKSLFTIVEGSLDEYASISSQAVESNNNLKTAVIGQKLAELLSIHPGDTFRIITTKTNNGKISPKLTSFKVAAIISSGYQELDALWVFIPIEAAYEYLSLSNASYTVMIETPDAFSPDLVRIQQALKKLRAGRYANFYRWDQIHAAEFQNFSSTKVMLVFIMMLIVLVASVNVSSAIVMLVMERRKEIAILKSIGASPNGITLSFLITGMACGGGGVLIGMPIGILASLNANTIINSLEKIVNGIKKIFYIIQGVPASEISSIKLMDPAYYLQTIPVDISFLHLILIALSTILLSLIVSIIPSVKAGKEKPLAILRKS